MRSHQTDAWQSLAVAFDAFPYAPGFQEAMVGNTILIPRTSAAAFIKRQTANEAQQPENDDDPGTGDPGRKSKGFVLYMAELERRIAAGELQDHLADEAKSLEAWFKENHKGREAPVVGTIQNRIRPRYNQARNEIEG